MSSCINRRKLVPERVDRGGTLRYAWLRAPPLRHAIKIKPKPQLGCLTQEAPYEGGVISPCLSNIFLHHVLDEWFVNEVKPRLKGNSTLVRFADDAVMAFADFQDAKRGSGCIGQATCAVRAHAPSRQDTLCRFPQQPTRWQGPPGHGWDNVHLPRLLPRLGKVAEG